MVRGIITREVLERIPGERVAAVVVDGFDGRAGEEPHALAGGQEGRFVGDAGAERVEEEAFERVVVEGAEGVGDVEAVVAGVECRWRKKMSVSDLVVS